jgi:putative membrane protein
MMLPVNLFFQLRTAVLANILVALVAVIHLYILVLEMFLWETPAGRKAFKLSVDFARDTRVLAANQGLYNGFLAAGLLWGLWLGDHGAPVTLFFLSCVVIAGIFGAVTASRKILYVQAVPAVVALITVMFR